MALPITTDDKQTAALSTLVNAKGLGLQPAILILAKTFNASSGLSFSE
uniref:Uncharacterized protein n=1 Tax=Arundo donax TaxID=35708 RepID=A0A0A8YNA1_ARUDO